MTTPTPTETILSIAVLGSSLFVMLAALAVLLDSMGSAKALLILALIVGLVANALLIALAVRETLWP